MVDAWLTRPWRDWDPQGRYDTTTDPAARIAAGLTSAAPGTGWGGGTPVTTFADPALFPASGRETVAPLAFTNRGGGTLARGAGQAATAAGAPDWARFTGGNTGSSYDIAGFNPWTNLARYNGGQYQAGGDDRGRDPSTPGGEEDIARVFRWTNDLLRAQGIGQNDPRAASIFAANVERLRSEYAAAGADWGRSKFARFGNPAAPAPATPPPAAPAAPATRGGAASGPAGRPTTGGSTMSGNIPGMGAGLIAGTQGVGQLSVPQGGYGPTSGAAIGQDPDLAYRALLASQGKAYAPRGLFTKFRQNLFGNALVSYINLLTSGGGQTLDNINGLLADFGGAMNSGNFYGRMGDAARGALGGIDLGALDPAKVDQLLKQAMGLETMGLSPFAQNAAQNRYQDTIRGYEDTALTNDMQDTQNYGEFMKTTPFWNALRGVTGR